MFCERCGAKLENGVKFCAACGNKIEPTATNVSTNGTGNGTLNTVTGGSPASMQAQSVSAMEVIKPFEPLFGEWYVDSFIGAGSFGRVY